MAGGGQAPLRDPRRGDRRATAACDPVEQGEGDSVVAVFARAGDAVAAGARGAAGAATLERGRTAWRCRCAWRCTPGRRSCATRATTSGRRSSAAPACEALAHGGQVLLSRATHDLVQRPPAGWRRAARPRRPPAARPRPARARVRAEPSRPRRGASRCRRSTRRRTTSPHELSSFVGRERELAELREALAATRLLTLTGPGGAGKTRLALRAASEVVERVPRRRVVGRTRAAG